MANLRRGALVLFVLLGALHWLLSPIPFAVVLAAVFLLVVLLLRRHVRREEALLCQLECAGDLYSRHRLDGTFLYASTGFRALLGVDPAALPGQRRVPGWRVADTAALAGALRRAAAGEQPVCAAICLRHTDGRTLWLEGVARRVAGLNARGGPEIVVIARDVTARRRAEAQHALNERWLRLITESMQEVLWLRVGNELQYINSAYERVSGLPREVLANDGLRGWLPWIHPKDRDRMRLALDQAVLHHEPLDEEFRLVRPDGQVRWLHARTVHVETGPDGQLETVGVAADITRRRQAEDTLRVAASRQQSLFETAHVGVTITDLAGTLLYANSSAAALFGAESVKDLLAFARRHDGIRSFFRDPQEREQFIAELTGGSRGRASRVIDLRRLDGRIVNIHVSCGVSVNPESGRTELFTILDDVTGALAAQAELRRSEESYRRLVDFLPDGVLVHDGKKVVFGNPACDRLFGVDDRNLPGTNLATIVPPESLAYLVAAAAANGGDARGPVEIWLRRRDGSLFPASVVSLPLTDAAGPQTLTVVKDLTRLRRYGEEIAAQQEILSALVETVPLGIVAKDLDRDLRYVIWNAYMESELGLPKEAVLGRRDADLFQPEFAAAMRRHDQQAAARGQPQDLGEISLLLGDRRLDLHVVNVPVRDADGKIARVFSLVENVTRQKQLLARLQQASKMEAIGRLAGAVAHDFNNMLQVVQGYTESIQHGVRSANGFQDEAGLVLTAVNRARDLVQRLLTYSRYDALQPKLVDLNRVVDQAAAMSRGVLPPGIELAVRQATDLPLIYADPQQLEQVVLNLVLNSRDALPQEGRIEIETSLCELDRAFCTARPWAKPGRYLQVTVRDNGCGIHPDAREHVYEPFYTTKGFGYGTGLGLATAYSICKQHQGYIDFESELDVGTAFHMFLPLLVSEQLQEPESVDDPPAVSGRGELVLLVEDDDMVRSLTRHVLEHAGYQVLEARDGEDAMEVFMAHAAEVQLLILDVVMPRMDGRALYDNISELRPGVPVLFCSSYSADLLESEYMLRVGGLLLAKPYRAVELLRRVRTMLDRNGES